MSAPASIPIFGDAYLADTQHLTLEEHGAYFKLLLCAWRTPACELPADDKRIATMLGVSSVKWAKLKPTILAFWTQTETGWEQKRLTKERKYVEEKSQKNRAAVNTRWNANRLNNNDAGDTNEYTNEYTPPPPPIKEERKRVSNDTLKESLPVAFDGFAAFWRAYPRRTAKAAAEKAWPKACSRAPPADIIAAATRYAAHPPDDPKFIPHPATWLNQARFEDEEPAHGHTAPRQSGGDRKPSGRLGVVYDLLAETRAQAANDQSRNYGTAG